MEKENQIILVQQDLRNDTASKSMFCLAMYYNLLCILDRVLKKLSTWTHRQNACYGLSHISLLFSWKKKIRVA